MTECEEVEVVIYGIAIRPGDVLWTWCSHCMERTDHRWTGYKLVCLACKPEGK